MIYDVRKATIERDRRRRRRLFASSSSSSSSGAATTRDDDDDDDDFDDFDDDVLRENDIEVNVDAALANLARERRGQTLFQRFMEEEEEDNEENLKDLFHGACLIAMHRNPDLDVDEMKRRVRELADEVEKELPA